jgi:beta-glucanase (GH16 family)
MLPNDDVYGGWASSGEIDVMEARGRLTGSTSGTIHYGGTWPTNTYTGSDYVFENGSNFTDGFHVYSAVWEEDNIKWYVDGTCFFQATAEQWYSMGAQNNPNAPFDQEFYIIMNLALGGWFDGGLTPNLSDLPATMEVDYVRVYQEQGSFGGSYTDNSTGDNGGSDEDPADNPDEDLVNLAAHKPVTVSGVENVVFGGANLTDGDEGTRWSSDYEDDAWFVIDLEESCEISQIVLLWETAYGTEYDLMVSADGTNWQTVAEERDGQGGSITYDFQEVNARYVKMQGIERALIYGYSLWEVEVNGT